MQIKSSDARFMRPPQMLLSTISLPIEHHGCWYETMIFFNGGDSELLGRHISVEEALRFHAKKEREYNLRRV